MTRYYGIALTLVLAMLLPLTTAKSEEVDTRKLFGEWTGEWFEGGFSGGMSLVFYEDGRPVKVSYDTPRGRVSGTNRLTFTEKGEVVLQSSRTTTVLTLRDKKGQLTLEGDYEYSSGQRGTMRLKKK